MQTVQHNHYRYHYQYHYWSGRNWQPDVTMATMEVAECAVQNNG